MNEGRKLFRPLVCLISIAFILALLRDVYTCMYYGEYKTRLVSQQLYRHARDMDDRLAWLTEYREANLSRIEAYFAALEEAQTAESKEAVRAQWKEQGMLNGLYDDAGVEILALNRLIKRETHINGLAETWERERKLAQRAAKRTGKTAQSDMDAFAEMKIPEYGNYQPYEDLIDWNRKNAFLLLLLFCGVCAMAYPMEYRERMNALIRVQAVHPMRVVYGKMFALSGYIAACATAFFVGELGIAAYMAGSVRELLQSAQALYCMGSSRLQAAVWTVIFRQYIALLCAGALAGGVTLFLSTLFRYAWGALTAGIAVLALPQILISRLADGTEWTVRAYLGAVEQMRQADGIYWRVSAGLAVLGAIVAFCAGIRFVRGRYNDAV